MRLYKLLLGLLVPLGLLGQASAQNRMSMLGDSSTPSNVGVATPSYLLKAGFNLPLLEQSSIVVRWWTLGTDVTLEHKLIQRLTLTAGLANTISFGAQAQLYAISMPIGIRYYFPLGQRMKQGADQHRFFSPYLALQAHNVLLANLRYSSEVGVASAQAANYYRGQMVSERINGGNLTEWFNLGQYGYLMLGWQWRTSRATYLDVGVVVPIPALIYHKTPFTLATPALVTLKYGLLW